MNQKSQTIPFGTLLPAAAAESYHELMRKQLQSWSYLRSKKCVSDMDMLAKIDSIRDLRSIVTATFTSSIIVGRLHRLVEAVNELSNWE